MGSNLISMLICFLYIADAAVLACETRLRYIVQPDRPRSQFLFIWHCPGGLAAPIQLKEAKYGRRKASSRLPIVYRVFRKLSSLLSNFLMFPLGDNSIRRSFSLRNFRICDVKCTKISNELFQRNLIQIKSTKFKCIQGNSASYSYVYCSIRSHHL